MSNMKKKAVMKVGMKTPEDKIDIMKAVAKLKGVEYVTLDGERQKLTVIGEVNPCLIAKKVGKSGKGKTVDLLEVKTGRSVQELNRPNWGDYYRYNNNCNYDSSYYDCPPRTTYDYCPPRITYECPPRIRTQPECYKVVCNDAPGECSIL
ncbi:uncharacterized protein LOC113334959 [Papaver somniferum]|uniref:uncharacterized protein LOC113334959 n=1 Tax=Papaver somniferum TaxID=3469 RepID=UPI000E6F58D9|nr:uncharacterized protein LOC113334959 [Papaver somniferum]